MTAALNDCHHQDFEPDEEEDEKSVEKRKQLEIQKEIKALKRELKSGGKGQKSKGEDKEEEVEEGDKLTEEERANDMLRSFHEEQGGWQFNRGVTTARSPHNHQVVRSDSVQGRFDLAPCLNILFAHNFFL